MELARSAGLAMLKASTWPSAHLLDRRARRLGQQRVAAEGGFQPLGQQHVDRLAQARTAGAPAACRSTFW